MRGKTLFVLRGFRTQTRKAEVLRLNLLCNVLEHYMIRASKGGRLHFPKNKETRLLPTPHPRTAG